MTLARNEIVNLLMTVTRHTKTKDAVVWVVQQTQDAALALQAVHLSRAEAVSVTCN